MNAYTMTFAVSLLFCALGLGVASLETSPASAQEVQAPSTYRSPARSPLVLAAANQRTPQDNGTHISPRSWGKLIRVGILIIILLCGGAVWLFNKLKAQ